MTPGSRSLRCGTVPDTKEAGKKCLLGYILSGVKPPEMKRREPAQGLWDLRADSNLMKHQQQALRQVSVLQRGTGDQMV